MLTSTPLIVASHATQQGGGNTPSTIYNTYQSGQKKKCPQRELVPQSFVHARCVGSVCLRVRPHAHLHSTWKDRLLTRKIAWFSSEFLQIVASCFLW